MRLAAAAQVDIDLSGATSAGAVQLELWQGHQVLVSAPLLLLPSYGTMPSPDPLFDELQQCIHQFAWEPEPDSQSPPAGAADPLLCTLSNWVAASPAHSGDESPPSGVQAWLSDLGQLLYAGAVIEMSSAGPALGGPAAGSVNHNKAPASAEAGLWGGVTAATVKHYSENPAVLSSMLQLAGGLHEFAESEALPYTASLVASLTSRVRDRLGQLRSCSWPAFHPTSQDDFQLVVMTSPGG